MTAPGRAHVLARLLIVVGAIALAGGLITAYVHHALTNTDHFADRATAAYSHPGTREALTGAVVEQLLDAEPELVAVQPVLETVVDGVFQSEIATRIFSEAVGDLHKTIFTDSDDTVTIKMTELAFIAKSQLTALDPEIGALIPDEFIDVVVEVDTASALVDLGQAIDAIGMLALLLPLVAMAAFGGALILSGDPIRTTLSIGLATAAAGAAVLVASLVTRSLVVGSTATPEAADVARELWAVFVGDLALWAIILVAIGSLIACLVWFGVQQLDASQLAARVVTSARQGESRRGQFVWGAIAVLVGVALVLDWQSAVQFAAAVLGAGLVAGGVLTIVVSVAPQLADESLRDRSDADRSTQPTVRRWLVLGIAVLGVLTVGAMFGTVRADGGSTKTSTACNGSALLCDQRLDQVVFAATHNSQAASSEDFLLGNQQEGIIGQLESGIRALLIDVYFGLAVEGDVFTDRAPMTADERVQLVADFGEGAVVAAEAASARSEEIGGERQLYLCHAFCEIGATPFVAELTRIREFLDNNPREVVMLIIQDEGPLPSDVSAAFETSGLDKLVYQGALDSEMPTLQEMIDSGGRVLVSAENRPGEYVWYHDAFALTQDTPFTYDTVESFDCKPNRGRPDSPLLLVNHWLAPVSPTSAEMANQSDVLLARIDQCIDDRGLATNVLAVDFAELGDVIEVVAQLNRERTALGGGS